MNRAAEIIDAALDAARKHQIELAEIRFPLWKEQKSGVVLTLTFVLGKAFRRVVIYDRELALNSYKVEPVVNVLVAAAREDLMTFHKRD